MRETRCRHGDAAGGLGPRRQVIGQAIGRAIGHRAQAGAIAGRRHGDPHVEVVQHQANPCVGRIGIQRQATPARADPGIERGIGHVPPAVDQRDGVRPLPDPTAEPCVQATYLGRCIHLRPLAIQASEYRSASAA
ncbi:hypothetical protein D3C86_1529750 [compost metagenome]